MPEPTAPFYPAHLGPLYCTTRDGLREFKGEIRFEKAETPGRAQLAIHAWSSGANTATAELERQDVSALADACAAWLAAHPAEENQS